jgi:hypothetical protein
LLDAAMPLHYDAMMRTTIDLPESLHSIAMGLARHTGRSLSQAVADLMQRGLDARSTQATVTGFKVHPKTGLPVVQSRQTITAQDVASLEDDA